MPLIFRKRKRDMSFRRRGDGLSVVSAIQIDNGLGVVSELLATLHTAQLPPVAKQEGLQIAFTLLNDLLEEATYIEDPLPHVYNENRGRGLDTLDDEVCYRELRFGKGEIIELLTELDFPPAFVMGNGLNVSSESAFLFFLYRIHYPSTLAMMQSMWGFDYSALSRIFTFMVETLYESHSHCVLNNFRYYRLRLDVYNQKIKDKYASTNRNPNVGTVPANLYHDCGYLDGTAHYICRPFDGVGDVRNVQNLFYNRHKRRHIMNWLGFAFPDGMMALDGPFPGYFTDSMSWTASTAGRIIGMEMNRRVRDGMPRLFFRADKIFNDGANVRAMWSRRRGDLQPWMIEENAIASSGRACVELNFGVNTQRSKFIRTPFTQKARESPLTKQYVLATLMTNCKTCMAGNVTTSMFGLEPPTLQSYLSQ